MAANLPSGDMVIPTSTAVRSHLEIAARRKRVPIDGRIPH